MLISMTGFGSASADDQGVACSVEIRSVNNRFFKASIRLPDRLANLEPEIDRILRHSIIRGSIVLTVSVKDRLSAGSITVNQLVLKTYLDQLRLLRHQIGVPGHDTDSGAGVVGGGGSHIDITQLLMLPGVVEAGEDSAEYLAKHEALVLRLVRAAIDKLNEMRRREGTALFTDLQRHVEVIRVSQGRIAQLAPAVAQNYHERLKARVNQLVADAKLSLSDHDLLKEVALFADRADISEELARLGGHLEQFVSVCTRQDAPATPGAAGGAGGGTGNNGGDGRKLDFIAQEMLREANTIASKANDSAIARLTVDMKSAIDRIKEQVQNAE